MQYNRQSTLLNEQELQLLASVEAPLHNTLYPLYSMVECKKLLSLGCNIINDIAVLTLQLTASTLGSAVIISENIESSEHAISLLIMLKKRPDITVFWLGKLPSMSFDLPRFIYCVDFLQLENKVQQWESNNLALFHTWLQSYKVGIISQKREALPIKNLRNIALYNAEQAINSITDIQLLIINLNTPQLRLIEILNNLIANSETPFLLLYGDMQTNLSHAIYNLANNMGFSIIASLDSKPSQTQTQHILMTLFSKIYLKHWINAPAKNLTAKGIYNLNSNKLEGTFFPYGMNQSQITDTYCPPHTRKIVNIHSIFDWYPDGLKRDDVEILIKKLRGDPRLFDLHISQPQHVKVSSPLFMFLVIARLNKFRIYWTVKDEKHFSLDMLMFLPISDVLLSRSITNQLLTQPSLDLLDFLQEAQQQNIRLGAVMEHNDASIDVLSLYGIEVILTDIN